jgi:CBS domain-containing protein
MHRLRNVLQQQNIVSAEPTATVYEVAALMARSHVGAVPIVADERLIGIFSERDLMTRVVVPQLDPQTTPVSEVMTNEVVTASLQEHVDGCIDKMKAIGCRHLPVVAEGRIIGMLSMRDLLRDELKEQDHEIRSLKAYLHQTPI